jgi:hypothetical protein
MKVMYSILSLRAAFTFRAVHLLALLAVAIIAWPQNVGGQQQSVPKLNLAQIEELVSHHVPDATLSTQIQRLGLAFAPSQATVDSLRAKGAGPQTLAAIEALVSKPPLRVESNGGGGKPPVRQPHAAHGVGILEIHTEPGSDLFLDDKEVGNANEIGAGFFRLKDVAEGSHELAAKQAGFQDAHVSLALANKEDKQISLPLERLEGFLTVISQPEGAEITVSGPKTFSGVTNDVACPPGSYTASVSFEGYVPETRTFDVGPGEHHRESIQLAIDSAYVARLNADAAAKLDARNPAGAIEAARKVLKFSPGDAGAAQIIAEASFLVGDTSTFANLGSQAIQGGKAVSVQLMHVHNFPHRMINPATVTISASGLAISVAASGGDKIPPSIEFNLVTRAEVIRDQTGAIELHISYLSKPPGTTAIGTLHDLDFVADGSAVVTQRGGQPGNVVVIGGQTTVIQSPQNAAQLLQGVATLIGKVKR